MKHLTFLLLCAAFMGLAFTNPASNAVVVYKVDTNTSTVKWTAAKVTGKHFGKVPIKVGTLEMNKSKLVGASFEVNMAALTVEDGGGNERLRGHLTNDDFFATDKHPTASFKATKVTAKDKVGNYTVVGNMVIKNLTKSITFDANIKSEGGKVMGTAVIKLDRTDYDIKFRSGKFFPDLGDKLIYDEFELEVSLVAAK
ncbi:YceI family protein [Haliscomenobacter hydrossis]|uniref:YceI family protein n=1 Tax=Haliscomenobacter hydrossis (strain ATCC 27775 / DSM 1100 / LMG 10767 / O) TaxID=760192 RepID=F4L5R4_HALH1|nr:YceI family protein [Haliscomenobacter hydrossis]AEE52024.1 YceI family protein [Haliscomenobacter hydrossis DSM 1100]